LLALWATHLVSLMKAEHRLTNYVLLIVKRPGEHLLQNF